MFPLALSLFDTGLLVTMLVFVILYIIVLVKLKPSSGEGKVQKIRGVIRRTDSNAIYSKPLNEDRDKVLDQYSSFHREYNSRGNILKKHVNSEPGMLFDALV